MKMPILLLCALPFFAAATEIPEKDWECERLDDDHVVIRNPDQSRRPSAIDQNTEGDIVVPATLRSMQVVSIGEKAFYHCTNLTSVTIPEGVTNIAVNAFYGCSKLAAANFAGASLAVGTHAFRNCSAISELIFSGDLIDIGEYAFSGCTGLRDVALLSKSVKTRKCSFSVKHNEVNGKIESAACTGLTNVLVRASDASIGTVSFSGCTALANVNLSVGTLDVGVRAFGKYNYYSNSWTSACSALSVLTVDADSVTLGASSFSGCASLGQVDVSTSDLMSLGGSAFSNCTSLQRVVVASSNLMSVGSSAFSNCASLQRVVVASSNLTVGASAFSSCKALGSFVAESSILSIGRSAFADLSALSNAEMTASFSATIGVSAFSSCPKLQAVELPVALAVVPTNAFYSCTALESVFFPSNVTHISYRAFDTCTALKAVTFSEGQKSIAEQAFYGCKSITDLAFPQSLESVGARAFERCDALADVSFSEGNAKHVSATSVTLGERAFYQCSALTNVFLVKAVSSIGARAFSQCESLEEINLPTSLTEIAESTFEDCSSLVEIGLPDSLESVGNTAFFGCTGLKTFLIPTENVVTLGAKAFKNTRYWNEYPNDLVVNNGYILGFKGSPTDVTLPDGCKSIPVAMFEGMETLRSVTIPDSVTEIGARAFNGCSGITNLAFRSVTTIGNSAFEGCASLVGISLSQELTALPGNCFKDCTSLVSVFIPDDVVSVGEYAFFNCAALAVVSGGAAVDQVGDYAFAQCPELQPFEFKNDVTYGEHVFQGCTWTEHVLFPSVGTLKDEYPASYSKIRSVVFSSGLTTITNRACSGCSALTSVRIPEGVSSIGDAAFENCTALTNVTIRCVDAAVGVNLFAGCALVRTVSTATSLCFSNAFPQAYAEISSVELLEGMTEIVDSAFEGCAALSSMKLPVTITSIGASAFAGCVNFPSTIIIPAAVTSIGNFAFSGCENLTRVNYFGDSPSPTPTNLYSGTSISLWSGVLKEKRDGWGGEAPTKGSTALFWPAKTASLGGRRLVVWAPTDEDFKASGMMKFYHYNRTGTCDIKVAAEGLTDEPDREGYLFGGWYSEPYGKGRCVTEENVSDFAAAYAYWVLEEEEDEGDVDEPDTPVEYDFSRANAYVGSVMDGEIVVGNVQISFAKGRADKKTGDTTAKATAKVQLLGEGQLSMRGTLLKDGTADLTVSGSSRTMSVEMCSDDADRLTGMIDGYEVVAYRDLSSSSVSTEKSRATAFFSGIKGKYVAVVEATGEAAFSSGYAALSVDVSEKGTVKVTGTMPDGKSVSASSQLAVVMTEDESVIGLAAVVAAMYSKKGGFAFALTFSEGEPSLSGVSTWIADKSGTEVPLAELGIQSVSGLEEGDHAFAADVSTLQFEDITVEKSLSPDGTVFYATEQKWTLPKSDTVRFDKDKGYEIKKDNGNPAALKLTYSPKTGMFTGSFKVFGVTSSGRSKTYTATLKGGVLGGMAFGTAVVKKIGSLPVEIE